MLFRDVPIKEWFAPYIGDLIQQGIVSGYKDSSGTPTGEYAPEKLVSIAEVLKMAMEAFREPATSSNLPANRSAKNTWVSPYVARAEELNLAFLTSSVDVHTPSTRALAIQIFAEAAGLDLTAIPTESLYSDVPISMGNAAVIDKATRLCWVQGDTDGNGDPKGTFRPRAGINRAEVAKILSVILSRRQ